jgi:predicted aspartyl protease
MNGKETLGVVDTAAQVTVLNISLFEQTVPRPKTTTTIVMKVIGKSSEMNARLVPNVGVKIGKSNIKWDMVVADTEDNLILGLYFLDNEKVIINLTEYSIELRGEQVPSMLFSTNEKQQNKI